MKKPIYKKWWFWLILAFVFFSMNVNISIVEKDEQAFEVVSEVQEQAGTAEVALTTSCVGEIRIAESYTLAIESIEVLESDYKSIQPEEGYEFVGVTIVLDNTSNSDLTVYPILDFDAYVDSFSINEDAYASIGAGTDSVGGILGSGKKIRGTLCYSLPEGWNELEILVNIAGNSEREMSLLFQK